MAGHSHAHNVANRKNAVDKKKAKIFTRIAKLITIAVNQGNSNNPDLNPKLRLTLKMAQNCNVPKDIITKALSIDKESGSKIEEILYEGYLGGTAILALAQTTNKNKTAPEIRYIFSKENGSIAEPNSVAFMFDKISKIECEVPEDKYDEFMEDAIEAEAKDVIDNIAYFAADQLHTAQLKLEKKWNILLAELQYEPNIYSTKGDIEKIEKLIEKLEENESIQACWHNFKSEDE